MAGLAVRLKHRNDEVLRVPMDCVRLPSDCRGQRERNHAVPAAPEDVRTAAALAPPHLRSTSAL